MDVVVESTGLKVFGDGERKGAKTRYEQTPHLAWRKRHLGVDPNSHDVVVTELSSESIHDGEVLPDLLD